MMTKQKWEMIERTNIHTIKYMAVISLDFGNSELRGEMKRREERVE